MKKRRGLGRLKLESDSQRLLSIISGSMETENVVIFKIADDPFAIHLQQVHQILRASKYTVYSDISKISTIRGYIFHRKEPIPVISIHRLLEMNSIEDFSLRTSLIICKVGEQKFGLLSEDVMEVTPIENPELISKIPNGILTSFSKLFIGAFSWREQPVLMMNLDNLFTQEDLNLLIEEGKNVAKEYLPE